MSTFVPIMTPAGTIWAEVEEHDEIGIRRASVSGQDAAASSFEDAFSAIKGNAQYIFNSLRNNLSPDELEISFGIKAGVEGGQPFFGVAKTSSEGNYSIRIVWKKDNM